MQENKMRTSELVGQCVDGLISEKGLDKLDKKNKDEVKKMLSDSLTEQINRSILYALPDEKLDELESAMGQDDFYEGRLQQIIESAHLNGDEIVKETVERFRNAFLAIDTTSMFRQEARA